MAGHSTAWRGVSSPHFIGGGISFDGNMWFNWMVAIVEEGI